MPPGEGGNHPAGVNQPGPRWAMTKKQSGCLAVGELTQSLKKRLGLPCPLHRVLAAETGAPNGSTKKDELSGSIDLETRGEEADVQVGVGTIRELALTPIQVEPNLSSCIYKPVQGGTDFYVVAS